MIEKTLEIAAKKENLNKVFAFMTDTLSLLSCPKKEFMQIKMVLEEFFINIASYAYGEDEGNVTISFLLYPEENKACITIIDSGMPFNPLEHDGPDTSLSLEEKPIGGLGIFYSRQKVDDMVYTYKNGKNILCLTKVFSR